MVQFTAEMGLEELDNTSNPDEAFNDNMGIIDLGGTYKLVAAEAIDKGEWVGKDASDEAELSQADSVANAMVLGIAVKDTALGDDLHVRYAGVINVTGWGLTANSQYYLDPSTPGAMTITRPTGSDIVVELGESDSTGTKFYIRIRIYNTIVLGGDHSTLNNLTWSTAGHTIDTDLDLNNNELQEVKKITGNTFVHVSIGGTSDKSMYFEVGHLFLIRDYDDSFATRWTCDSATGNVTMTGDLDLATGNIDNCTSIDSGGGTLELTDPILIGSSTAYSGTTPAVDIVNAAGFGFVMSNVVTDATTKACSIGLRHYTNAEQAMLGFRMESNATVNTITYGGGSSLWNAATNLAFYAAANNTTVTGTKVGEFTITGLNVPHALTVDTNTLIVNRAGYLNKVGINTTSPGYALTIMDGNSGDAGLEIKSASGKHGFIKFTSVSSPKGYLGYDNTAGVFKINGRAGFTAYDDITIDTSGNVTMGVSLTVEGEAIVDTNIAVGTDSPSASFSGTGDIYATSGIKAMEGLYAEAVPYGAGLEISDNALVVKYTNIAHGDATLTAATQIVTDSHASFDSTYVGQFFKVIGSTPSYTGATGEIIAVLSGTTIRVSFGTAGGDTIVNATAMSFVIYPEPRIFVGDNGDTHFCIGVHEDASFKVCTDVSNNEHAVHFVSKAGVNGNAALEIEYDPDTYSDCSAIEVGYDATGFAAADTQGTILDVIIDNVGASDGEIHTMDVALSDPTNTDMAVTAVGTHEGVDVIHQSLGTPASITKAYITDASGSINETTLAFVDSDPDTITDSGDGFVAAGFVAGQVITVSGSTSNDGTYTIATVAVGTLTLEANDSLTAEAAGDDVTITSTFRDVTTALGAAGTDVELFGADNDVLLMASAVKWDETNIILDTEANRNIRPDFYFIEDDGDWIEFNPADDTNGFQGNGTVRFDEANLATWGERTINEVVGAYGSTDYYWQKITRTRNNLATPPVEDTIKITALNADLGWDANGRLSILTYSQSAEPDTDDIPANHFCFWIDTDDSKLYLCYNQSGTIKTTEMT